MGNDEKLTTKNNPDAFYTQENLDDLVNKYEKRIFKLERDLKQIQANHYDDIIMDIITVVDNLERALSFTSENQDVGTFMKGVEMTYKGLINVLSKYGVEQMDALGEVFNHNYHNAVETAYNSEYYSNRVIEIVTPGYMRSGKLLRPASVIVSK